MLTLKRLTLDQAEAGMRLAQDVCSSNGTCLLPLGTILSHAVITALKRREVDYVMMSMEEALSQEQHAAMEERIKERIEQQFCKTDASPTMLKLRDLLLRYRITQLNRTNPPVASDDD